MRDLLIVGGGPAGLAAAIYARLAGLSVTLLEYKNGVIDKACGEGLMPGGVKALAEIGVEIDEYQYLKGIHYVLKKEHAKGHFHTGKGLGIRRLVLHKQLLQRATELGVELIQHKANQISQYQDHVNVDGFCGRYLIAADGLKSPIRRILNLERPQLKLLSNFKRYGLRRHFKVPPWTENYVEIHITPYCEAYVTPVAKDMVGVALLFGDKLRQKYAHQQGKLYNKALCSEFPNLCEKLTQPCSDIYGAGPFLTTVKRRVENRILLIGDAAGYVDPLTGEGLRLSFLTAKAAIQAIQNNCPATYDKQWKKLTFRYRLITSLILIVRRNWLTTRVAIFLLRKMPRVFDWSLTQIEK